MKTKILMSLTLGLVLFAANADAAVECRPEHKSAIRKVLIVEIADSENYVMRVESTSGGSVEGVAEYGDDVDAMFYFSEDLNAQLEYRWAEMNEFGRASGSFITQLNGPGRQISTPVECVRQSSPF